MASGLKSCDFWDTMQIFMSTPDMSDTVMGNSVMSKGDPDMGDFVMSKGDS